jgi:hypothetical protein
MDTVKFEVKKTNKELIKLAISAIVGLSTSFCVKQAIQNNVEPEDAKEEAKLWIGSTAVGGLVAVHTKDYVDGYVDDAFAIYETIRNLKNKSEDTTEDTKETETQAEGPN